MPHRRVFSLERGKFNRMDSSDLDVEGATVFHPPPATTYRYVLELKNGKLSIWMEEEGRKKQWFKGDLVQTDYVTSANAIPGATANDYAKYFQKVLDSTLEGHDGGQRKLSATKSGGLILELSVKLCVLNSTRLATYVFELHPGSVERIYALEAKVRDLEIKVKRLQAGLQGALVPSLTQLEAQGQVENSFSLCWKETKSDAFLVAGGDGVVHALRAGVFDVRAVVNVKPTMSSHHVQLLKNNVCVRIVHFGGAGKCIAATLDATVPVKEEDELLLKCDCDLGDTSYMTAIRIWS